MISSILFSGLSSSNTSGLEINSGSVHRKEEGKPFLLSTWVSISRLSSVTCLCFRTIADPRLWHPELKNPGMVAQVSYAFHSERELHLEKFKNLFQNQEWF